MRKKAPCLGSGIGYKGAGIGELVMLGLCVGGDKVDSGLIVFGNPGVS